ncbi:hypothetical protein [Agriterribacter sp.]|mgnify:CR=1 FL=1|uniref:hypothetical protein n=1 Tax=Agriterribacter sp. TaxID=2821509 RepID=UPI002BDCE244|nr:hypothetical protein [Agriterribacter sp.]HRP56033.1 hypothetical protein [Agriterribacter sp.]
MKKTTAVLLGIILMVLSAVTVSAQCSICTKTAQQMGEKPAKALNAGILYLMVTPFAVVGFIGYRLWKQNRDDKA